MKITLDLEQLLLEHQITQAEYEKFSALAKQSTGSLAFNLLIGFGVIAVGGAALALLPTVATAIVIGLIVLTLGLVLLKFTTKQWLVLANICILIGALMAGGGIVAQTEGDLVSLIAVTLLFSIAGIFAQSSLLIVLATLMLSACIGAGTGYSHASYFLFIEKPVNTIVVFSLLAIGLYFLSIRLAPAYERIALAAARTGVFMVNFGFWVGSLWGERTASREIFISDIAFSIVWALAIIVTAIWAWQKNRRWVLNTVATFGGIHFYTQWFEYLGASAATVLVSGLIALGFALAMKSINNSMKTAG